MQFVEVYSLVKWSKAIQSILFSGINLEMNSNKMQKLMLTFVGLPLYWMVLFPIQTSYEVNCKCFSIMATLATGKQNAA